MTIQSLSFNGFNENNKYIQYFIELGENTFVFTVKWNEYSKCAFLTITDYEDNDIVMGIALVNGLKIRNVKLPFNLLFTHVNGETYEPTIDNIEKEFALVYEDGK